MADKSVETQIAEMARDVSYLRVEFNDMKTEIRNAYVNKYQFDNINKRVADIEDNNKWIIRTIGATVIGTLITAVLTFLR